MKKYKIRNVLITFFVIIWSLAFHYESLRYFYIQPFFKQPLPKIKFLFPPAGWIMFFRVEQSFGFVEVYGTKDNQTFELDLHDIFDVRTVGFDNIHRGIMNSAAQKSLGKSFCRHLFRKFKYFDSFVIVNNYFPEFIDKPFKKYKQVSYRCTE